MIVKWISQDSIWKFPDAVPSMELISIMVPWALAMVGLKPLKSAYLQWRSLSNLGISLEERSKDLRLGLRPGSMTLGRFFTFNLSAYNWLPPARWLATQVLRFLLPPTHWCVCSVNVCGRWAQEEIWPRPCFLRPCSGYKWWGLGRSELGMGEGRDLFLSYVVHFWDWTPLFGWAHCLITMRKHFLQVAILERNWFIECLVKMLNSWPAWVLDSSFGKEPTWNAEDLGPIPGLGRSPGEEKGYPLQYSGLENSTDCIVHGVTKSQTLLSDFHFHWVLGSSGTSVLCISHACMSAESLQSYLTLHCLSTAAHQAPLSIESAGNSTGVDCQALL